VVVAPKGPSYVFSPWEALDGARRRDVYTGLGRSKGLLSLGGILGGGKSQPILGKPAVKVANGAHSADTAPQMKWHQSFSVCCYMIQRMSVGPNEVNGGGILGAFRVLPLDLARNKMTQIITC